VTWLLVGVAFLAGFYTAIWFLKNGLWLAVQDAIKAERITATEAISFLERVGVKK
jgi:hypothetical protein